MLSSDALSCPFWATALASSGIWKTYAFRAGCNWLGLYEPINLTVLSKALVFYYLLFEKKPCLFLAQCDAHCIWFGILEGNRFCLRNLPLTLRCLWLHYILSKSCLRHYQFLQSWLNLHNGIRIYYRSFPYRNFLQSCFYLWDSLPTNTNRHRLDFLSWRKHYS